MSESWDTKEQLAVKAARKVVDEKHHKLIYALDGRREELVMGNHGEAREWIRHIDKAYEDFHDAVSELKDAEEVLRESKRSLHERIRKMK